MKTDKVCNWINRELRPTLTRSTILGGAGWCKNDCIRNAKMALAVLKKMEIEAKEISVLLLVANQPLAAYMRRTMENFHTLNVERAIKVPEAKMMRMGAFDDNYLIDGFWRGHLPLIVEDYLLLDMTLDSVNDQAPQMNLSPMIFQGKNIIKSLLEGTEIDIETPNGERILYIVDTENQAYQQTQAWTAWSPYHQDIVDRSIERLRELRII